MDGTIISILIIALGLLALWVLNLRRRSVELKAAYDRVLSSFHELDEQAKLIVKTDLELNTAQEELDKRLNGLDALQKTSRELSTTLDENEIFQRLNQSVLTELGLEKFLIFILDKDHVLQPKVDFGFPEEETITITGRIQHEQPQIMKLLKEEHVVSSVRSSQTVTERIRNIFHLKQFIMTPIIAQTKVLGFIFAGNESEAFAITEGDEELVSILADQVGHAVENARLFEQVYRSSQFLEMKVQERTRQLSHALEELKTISKAKSDFISAVSHELRTPLTSIKGYSSLLIAGKLGDVSKGVRERLEKINKHSDNLVQLINNLLDIARIELGKTTMNLSKNHDLRLMVESVRDLLTPQLRSKNIHFATTVGDQVPFVDLDHNQIERVLINLVNNAIKFTPENGSITVTITSDEKKITCAVTDTGIGMKKEDMELLFTEFYRVENDINNSVNGSGLGLALCKKIIQAHNGKIWVESEPGRGSTFYFTLPLDETENSS